MGGQFEKIIINNDLEKVTEKAAIDALTIDDKNTAEMLKTALSTEKLILSDGTQDTFLNMAKASNNRRHFPIAASSVKSSP